MLLSYIVLIIGSFIFVARGVMYGSSIAMVLQVSQKLAIIGFIYFCFISYEYQSLPKRLNLQETIDTIQSAKPRMFLSRLLLLILLVFIFTLIPTIVSTIYGGSVLTMAYFMHIVLNNILNIFLVGVLASILGSLVALKHGRISAYIIMLVAFFIISPFFENITFTLYILKDINLYPIWDVFRILPFDLDWVSDSFYGMAIEASRWNLIFIWITLLLAVYLVKISIIMKRNIQILSILLVMMLALNIYGYVQPGSVIRYDSRPDGASYGDHIYERDGYLTDSFSTPADYRVLSYDMHITIRRQLNADVTMEFETASLKDSYEFTLYRGYDITSITDNDGNAIDYTRSGNYFTINESFDEEKTTIRLLYEGSGNRYFSNYQGVALLGYVPYYPKPGHLKMWNNEENKTVVNADSDVSYYEVVVDSTKTVFSNLPGEKNTFSGETTGVTLVAGLIAPIKIAHFDVIAPTSDIISESELTKFEDYWNQIVDLLDLDEVYSIANKPYIFTPSVTTRASGADKEACVIMSDHVLLTENFASQNIYALINSILPYHEKKIVIKQCILDYFSDAEMFFETTESYLPDYDTLHHHIEHPLSKVNSEEDYIKYVESSMAMSNLVAFKMNTLGKAYVAREIYNYLADETTTIDAVDFLYNLQ
jgi:hypothetical protein